MLVTLSGNRTLIDNSNCRVFGGKTLVDGTGYKIKGGKTLVDGTNYDIHLDAAITIVFSDAYKGNGSNGVKIKTPSNSYNTPEGTYIFPVGTEISIQVEAQSTMSTVPVECMIKVNGEIVASKTAVWQSGSYWTTVYLDYVYVVKTDAILECDYTWVDENYYGDCEGTSVSITED